MLYNLAVARELAKQIYVAERLAPPNLAAVKEAYAQIWSTVSSPAALRAFASSGNVSQVGIYGLQAYGIFKVCTRCSGPLGVMLTRVDRLARSLEGGAWLGTRSNKRIGAAFRETDF